ncbi:hypothetical protein GCM10007920_36080 [Ciceribacter naphthalenivorans]|uniref:Uncharacterized protein n=2 Tax=Alphaproteobacteria TaxID=28211 RepID=A0A512HM12_9HYPH|nr:hypothetical protein RNA01_33910 [Ciceribacter naphthalenivorans]GLR23816.1 hypothetical protein GCM10007920_36080 [Ciceribacter naphthalenivorans]GLT06672.1 hypothetical protein GCM10007926_36080 [Sphingomonas psychrolutea]
MHFVREIGVRLAADSLAHDVVRLFEALKNSPARIISIENDGSGRVVAERTRFIEQMWKPAALDVIAFVNSYWRGPDEVQISDVNADGYL